MRLRSLAALAAAAVVSSLALAGCASSSAPAPTSSGDLAAAAAPSGTVVEAVSVSGPVDKPASATFTAPLQITSLQRSVKVEGTGPVLQSGDWVEYAFTAFDPETGKQVDNGAIGYTPGQLLPQQISPSSLLGQFLGAAHVGSRVVVAVPKASTTAAALYVIDVLGVMPLQAEGTDVPPTAGFPTATFAADGQPTVTVPSGATPPSTTQIEVLKKGSGPTVADNASVIVQYQGVKLSDGTVFDSSWQRHAPATLQTTGVVTGFKKALVGQTVGSRVIAVIPAAEAYGDKSASNTSQLAGEALVFVIDILATQNSAAG